MQKSPKRAINGVLLLDKPVGISSNRALQQAKHLFGAQKAGHTGVLDPLASGLLPICFGEATKFAQYLLDSDKGYTATLRLGEATTTGDSEGEIIDTGRTDITLPEFQAACNAFIGEIRQIPPMFSALKYEGKPLYEYARKGITIERKSRDVVIHRIDIQAFSPPQAVINVQCSKGTYIRTLAEDLAKNMHTFAHLTALHRTHSAGFSVAQTWTLDQLSAMDEAQRDATLLPCDAMVAHFPTIALDENAVRQLRFGQSVSCDAPHDWTHGTPLRVYDSRHHFVGLAEYFSHYRCLKALRLMNTAQYSP